jgi:ketosteroid isomerase-like protein
MESSGLQAILQAMSQENVEIVRRIYASVSRGDRGTLRDLAVPEFAIDFTRRLVEPGVVRGREEALAFLSQLRDPWDDWPAWEPKELLHSGDKVAALIRTSARGSGSGVEVEAYVWHLWTFRDGRLLELGYFGDDREAALEAAGLSDQG